MSLSAQHKYNYMHAIIESMYTNMRNDLIAIKAKVLRDALKHLKLTEPGTYTIYYDGNWHNITVPGNSKFAFVGIKRLDLPEAMYPQMDAVLLQFKELNAEIHNVEGLIRSVFNASETHTDISVLMPEMLKKKAPHFFTSQGVSTLSKKQIKEMDIKHEKMLRGIRTKTLRDLLLRK